MSANAQSHRVTHLQTNDRPNIQTYALCTFTFSLQTFTIFFLINAFINVYYNLFITSMLDTNEMTLIASIKVIDTDPI